MESVAQRSISISEEFEGSEFGDKRLVKRVLFMASKLSNEPDKSFPEVFDDAGLEGTYRFFNNDKIKPEAILAPHVAQTAKRTASYDEVLIVHDTSTFNFGTNKRKGLGPVREGKSWGFFGHVSLALAPDESREPLGVLAAQTIVRDEKKRKKKKTTRKRKTGTRRKKRSGKKEAPAPDNEGARWLNGVLEAKKHLPDKASAIHVMDREGDSYALLASLHQEQERFVIRVTHDRRVHKVHDDRGELLGEGDKIWDVLERAPVLGQREIQVSRRNASPLPATRKYHPPRSSRKATISVRASRITVKRSASARDCPLKELTFNVVQVIEENPPEGEPAVEWTLWTTEPIDSPEMVWKIVDIYRARWVIEEFFKALKTGCAYKKRQLESADALFRALALFLPIAWRLLLLRTLCRHDEKTPAEEVLPPPMLDCLEVALSERNVDLPRNPTVQDVLLGIAKLGGHLKNNGAPGWLVLIRGYEKLLLIAEGYRLAMKASLNLCEAATG